MEYGYARVSTKEQNELRQLIALREFGLTDRAILWTSSPARTLTVAATQRLLLQIERRRYACDQEHRPSRKKL